MKSLKFLRITTNMATGVCRLIGGALYLVGTFLVTLVFNVPKNKTLASVATTATEGASLWSDYLSNWTAWNHVRAAAALAAAALLTMALCRGTTMVRQEQAWRASIPTGPTAERPNGERRKFFEGLTSCATYQCFYQPSAP